MQANKNPESSDSGFCGRLDLNQHESTFTSPSSWRVYQFHHDRICQHTNFFFVFCQAGKKKRAEFPVFGLFSLH